MHAHNFKVYGPLLGNYAEKEAKIETIIMNKRSCFTWNKPWKIEIVWNSQNSNNHMTAKHAKACKIMHTCDLKYGR